MILVFYVRASLFAYTILPNETIWIRLSIRLYFKPMQVSLLCVDKFVALQALKAHIDFYVHFFYNNGKVVY